VAHLAAGMEVPRTRSWDAAKRLGICIILGCVVAAVLIVSQTDKSRDHSRRNGRLAIELLGESEASQDNANEQLAAEVIFWGEKCTCVCTLS